MLANYPPIHRLINIKITLAFIALLLLSSVALAHPGRTNSSGCHTCKTNCPNWGLAYGEYHCHKAKALPQPEEPIHSRYGEGGTGYTVPAPEYKNQPPVKAESKKEDTTAGSIVIGGGTLGAVGWYLKRKFFG